MLEDGAQSQGATRHGRSAGTFGDLAATSFYPGKNLGAYGDAGAVITDDDDLAQRVRLLGAHGSPAKYEHTEVGFNSRLDTLQAVVLRAKLRRLREWNAERREAAAAYDELLAGTAGRSAARHASRQRARVAPLRRAGGRPRPGAAPPAVRGRRRGRALPRTPSTSRPAMAELGYGRGRFPVSERAAGEILSLPIFPGITGAQQRARRRRAAGAVVAGVRVSRARTGR